MNAECGDWYNLTLLDFKAIRFIETVLSLTVC